MEHSAFIEFLIKYWLQFLLTLVSGGLTALCRKFYKDAKEERLKRKEEEEKAKEKNEFMQAAIRAILHDRLLSLLTYYLDKGEITTTELDNVKALYLAYRGLDGNGTIKTLYERMEQHCKIVAPSYVEHFV